MLTGRRAAAKGGLDPSSAEFFEAKYRADADPWAFAKSAYELRRYEAILKALAGRRYERGYEPGCSVGVLTERLAGLCERVEACDLSETAVARARERCAGLAGVRVYAGSVEDAPEGEFDLMVLSEIGYYLTRDAWKAAAERLVEATSVGGTVLGAHWLGRSADHRMSGDAVHEVLMEIPGMRLEYGERHEEFRLERCVRV